MRKITIFIAILSTLFLSFSTAVWAASDPKAVGVTLSDTPSVIKAGETVELTAVTIKHGSSHTDCWDNAQELSSAFDALTETTISKAVFTADKPGIYKIHYAIQMTAGNSNTVFIGEAEKTIEVIDPVTVIGAVIKDLTVKPVYRTDGSLYAYSASGRIYALWSDNVETPSGSTFFYFGPDETSKSVSVPVYVNGKMYTFKVTVTR